MRDIEFKEHSLKAGGATLCRVLFLLGDAIGQNTFPMKGANDTLKSCEEENVLKSPQCILREFNNPEILQEEMEKQIQGKLCRKRNA